jgi:hypothetical protein
MGWRHLDGRRACPHREERIHWLLLADGCSRRDEDCDPGVLRRFSTPGRAVPQLGLAATVPVQRGPDRDRPVHPPVSGRKPRIRRGQSQQCCSADADRRRIPQALERDLPRCQHLPVPGSVRLRLHGVSRLLRHTVAGISRTFALAGVFVAVLLYPIFGACRTPSAARPCTCSAPSPWGWRSARPSH